MSSRDSCPEERGEGTKSDSSSSGSSLHSQLTVDDKSETMKRAAVKQMIERYYHQLTDGCGNPDCVNVSCASSQQFALTTMTRDQAAAEALKLFSQKAQLCTDSPYKVAKSSPEQGTSGQEDASDQKRSPPANTSSGSYKPGTGVVIGTGSGSGSGSAMEVTSTDTEQNKQSLPAPAEYLTEALLDDVIRQCEEVDNWSRLIRIIGSVFNNPDSLVRSFLRCQSPCVSKEELRSMEIDQDKDTDDKDEDDDEGDDGDTEMDDTDTGDEPTGSDAKTSSQQQHVKLKHDEISLDIPSLRRAFTKLFALPEKPFQNALANALRALSRTMEMELRYHQAFERNPEYINNFIMVLEILSMDNQADLENATPHIFRAAGVLPVTAQAKLARVWAKYPATKLKEMLGFLQQVITLRILSTQWSSSFTFNDDTGITGAAKVMKILYYAVILGSQVDPPALLAREKQANQELEESLQELLEGAVGREKDRTQPKEDPLAKQLSVDPLNCRHPVLAWDDFINDLISDGVRMEKDYANYKGDSDKFSFLNHSFLLTTAMKNLGMYYDSKIRMVNERRVSLLQSLMNGAPTMPYLRIRIRRDHIIDDALVNLEMVAMDNPGDLKKQLYVEFEGEQGIDEGGVSKEFFQLVLEEIFNPDIGMFRYDEETRNFWFNSTSFENDSQFTLIGIVLGLAIYNNVILDVHFPMVVYRKLMGKLGTFLDLQDSHPTLSKSLQELLDYDGDVQETFMQTFSISYTDVFGSTISHNLKDKGDTMPVTNDNRQEFVDMYADFLLNKSVEKQFRAFKRGFHMVTDESPLKSLFNPIEIELLVCGSKNFDFRALEDATDYDGGYTAASPVIKYFWEVVHEFSEEEQRKLLQFSTGSDRVPVGGLAKLKLVIARHGPDSDRLPTAHTCFNVLLLPDYSSKEKLTERLSKAINYAKGFGML